MTNESWQWLIIMTDENDDDNDWCQWLMTMVDDNDWWQ